MGTYHSNHPWPSPYVLVLRTKHSLCHYLILTKHCNTENVFHHFYDVDTEAEGYVQLMKDQRSWQEERFPYQVWSPCSFQETALMIV